MGTDTNRHEFRAEVQQLLDLMVHSLYSNKDVFLRELISNASDALDRLRFEQLTDESLRSKKAAEIQLTPNVEQRTLTVADNGIGMSREEVIENLGTIARSGTKAFLAKAAASEKGDLPPEMIGQFGVGFYASFMVAKEVEVLTRRAGEEKATRWVSKGDGGYTVDDAERDEPGTTITLSLEPADEDNHVKDYTDELTLKDIVKRYSDFVAYPVKLFTWKEKEDSEAKVLEESVLNSQKAIWAKSKDDVTADEYKEFYKHIAHDWNDPLTHISVHIEGTFEAKALLYLPTQAPFDLYHPEMKRGVQLYVKRVFIMDECKELIPAYMRFVKGVVDAQDLSLNVSREILQKDRQLIVIKKQLVKKVFDKLAEIRDEDREQFDSFWSNFGGALKEGLVSGEDKERKRILELLLARSTHENTNTTLADYVSRMKDGQDAIYYLAGASQDAVKNSPHLEGFAAKGYEVLFFTDPIDEIWLARGLEFDGKKFVSVGKGNVELGSEEERKEAEVAREEKERTHKDLLTTIRSYLQDEVKEVRLSGRLTSSAACLVGDAGDLTPQMEKLMKQLGQEVPKTKRILELNPDHAVLERLQRIHDTDRADKDLETYAKLLYGQSILAEGGMLDDPAEFSQLVAELMVRAT